MRAVIFVVILINQGCKYYTTTLYHCSQYKVVFVHSEILE